MVCFSWFYFIIVDCVCFTVFSFVGEGFGFGCAVVWVVLFGEYVRLLPFVSVWGVFVVVGFPSLTFSVFAGRSVLGCPKKQGVSIA